MNRKRRAVLLGGPDCGKRISVKVKALALKCGGVYQDTGGRDKQGRKVYKWTYNWGEVCK